MSPLRGKETTEYASEKELLDSLSQRGFSAEFKITENGFKLLPEGPVFRPEQVEILEFHRFEGITDPDDMSVVYAVRSSDGTEGFLIDAYGTYADPRLTDLVEQVKMKKRDR